jgi:hypothetical protein
MLMLTLVFFIVFTTLAAMGMALAWALHSRAEARQWRERHQEVVHHQNHAAWERNREMLMH